MWDPMDRRADERDVTGVDSPHGTVWRQAVQPGELADRNGGRHVGVVCALVGVRARLLYRDGAAVVLVEATGIEGAVVGDGVVGDVVTVDPGDLRTGVDGEPGGEELVVLDLHRHLLRTGDDGGLVGAAAAAAHHAHVVAAAPPGHHAEHDAHKGEAEQHRRHEGEGGHGGTLLGSLLRVVIWHGTAGAILRLSSYQSGGVRATFVLRLLSPG